MEAKATIMDVLYSKERSAVEFNFDSLMGPKILNFIPMNDIVELRQLITSLKYNGKKELKLQLIDNIMRRNNCVKLAAGTNRIVYRPLDFQSVVLKIAFNKVSMGDSLSEYNIQHLLKPFVTKCFDVTPCGSIGLFEWVNPITSIQEFMSIAEDVFNLIATKFIGEFVLEDIGTKYFMNWGLRIGCGPVLLDYPYVYKLDGAKLLCNGNLKAPTGELLPCHGEIDYDDGFNHLICEICGKTYHARDISSQSNDSNKLIIIKGGLLNMVKITISRGDVIEKVIMPETEAVPKKQPYSRKRKNETLVETIDSDVTKINLLTSPIDRKVKKHKSTGTVVDEEVIREISIDISDIGNLRPEVAYTPLAEITLDYRPEYCYGIAKPKAKSNEPTEIQVSINEDYVSKQQPSLDVLDKNYIRRMMAEQRGEEFAEKVVQEEVQEEIVEEPRAIRKQIVISLDDIIPSPYTANNYQANVVVDEIEEDATDLLSDIMGLDVRTLLNADDSEKTIESMREELIEEESEEETVDTEDDIPALEEDSDDEEETNTDDSDDDGEEDMANNLKNKINLGISKVNASGAISDKADDMLKLYNIAEDDFNEPEEDDEITKKYADIINEDEPTVQKVKPRTKKKVLE